MPKPRVFISYRLDDAAAAEKVASRLETISENMEIHLAGNAKYEGPRVGKNINEELKEALGRTHLVILVFTLADEDWSYCTWECGIATDPNDDTPTSVVTLSLSGKAPKMLQETLIVNANDAASVKNFVTQLATAEDFIPSIGRLTNRDPNSDFIEEQSRELLNDLAPYAMAPEAPEKTARWGGFTAKLDAEAARTLRELDHEPDGEMVMEVLGAARVTDPQGWGITHFDFVEWSPDMTVRQLRERWEKSRRDHDVELIDNRAWSSILTAEFWRIATNRKTNLTWEPFLSLRDSNLWVYPIVYRYLNDHDGGIDFDILIVQTLNPGAPRN